jgi:hypothetical protein
VYVTGVLPLIADVTTWGLLVVSAAALVFLILPFQSGRTQRGAWFVIGWLAVIALLPVVGARLVTLRYAMPVSGPLVIVLARAGWVVWFGESSLPVAPRRAGVALLAGAWLGLFALPFLWTDWTDPLDLPLEGTNHTEYISGFLSADDGIRAAAESINQIPQEAPIYANWSLCHLLFFYTEPSIDCLSLDYPLRDLRAFLDADLTESGDVVYLALTGYEPFFERIDDLCWEEVAWHERPRITRPVGVWRLWRAPC